MKAKRKKYKMIDGPLAGQILDVEDGYVPKVSGGIYWPVVNNTTDNGELQMRFIGTTIESVK